MTPQEVFDNWSAYLRPVDRQDFLEALQSIAQSETTQLEPQNLQLARERDEARAERDYWKATLEAQQAPANPEGAAEKISGDDQRRPAGASATLSNDKPDDTPKDWTDVAGSMTDAQKATYWFDLYLEETTTRRALERLNAALVKTLEVAQGDASIRSSLSHEQRFSDDRAAAFLEAERMVKGRLAGRIEGGDLWLEINKIANMLRRAAEAVGVTPSSTASRSFDQVRDAIVTRMGGHTISEQNSASWNGFLGLLRQVKESECFADAFFAQSATEERKP